MPRLILESDEHKEFPLDKPVIKMGRKADNHIVLDDKAISSYHLQITTDGFKVTMKDLGSTNGTFLNGVLTKEAPLKHQDRIKVGNSTFIFLSDSPLDSTLTSPTFSLPMQVKTLEIEFDQLEKKFKETTKKGQLPFSPPLKEVANSLHKAQAHLSVLGRAYQRLAALYEASKLIISSFDLKTRLDMIMDTALNVLGAERGFIILQDEETLQLEVKVARKMGLDLHEESPSMSIANEVFSRGQPLSTPDALEDYRFQSSQSVILKAIRSVMCAPLRVEDRVIGAIYIDDTKRPNLFQREDEELFLALTSQSAIAIENVRLFEKFKREVNIRGNLQRYLPQDVVEQIMKSPHKEVELGGMRKEVTVLFSDIRGFTSLAEKMLPMEVTDFLNHYFTEMTEIVFKHKGTLDKFIGDSVMAVFGAPFSYGLDATRAVMAAIDMLKRMRELKEMWKRQGRRGFDIGIGINTGHAFAGNIGSPQRMEYTVIGDIVNVASRLAATASPSQILVSKDTFSQVETTVRTRSLGLINLKGREESIEAFEVVL